jgi:hypothetical protein
MPAPRGAPALGRLFAQNNLSWRWRESNPRRRVSGTAGQRPKSISDVGKHHACQYPLVTAGEPAFVSFSCLVCPIRVLRQCSEDRFGRSGFSTSGGAS